MRFGSRSRVAFAALLICALVTSAGSAAALTINPIQIVTLIDLAPPTLSYLAIQPASIAQTSTTSSVVVTAKFTDPSQPVEATATLTPPSSIVKALDLVIGPIIAPLIPRPLTAKFSAPGLGAVLPPGAPSGCVQAKFTLPANAKIGTWLLSIRARDSRGNTSTWLDPDLKAAGRPYSVKVTAPGTPGGTPVDTDPPVTLVSGVPSAWSKEPVLVQLDAADEASAVKATYYTLNGGGQQVYAAPFSVSAEGTTTVAFWSVDAVDNIEPTQAIDVLVDATPPTISSDAKASYTGSATIVMGGTDAGSGVYILAYSLDSAPEEYVEGSGAAIETSITVTESGDHTLAFAVWDQAENSTVTSSVVTFSITGGSSGTTETPGGETPGGETPSITDSLTVSGFPASGVKTVNWGAHMVASGTLTRADGEVGGLVVWLERLVGGVPESLGPVEVDSYGAFLVGLPTATAKAAYRMSFGEDYGLTPLYSKTFVVWPKVKLALGAAPSSVRRATAFKIRGTIAPVHSGKPVVVRIEQRVTKTKWKLWKNIALAAPKGAFSTSVKFSTTGVYRYSARLAPSDRDHAPTTTVARTVVVRK